MRRASKVMTEQEARQILGVTEETPWEEIIKVSISSLLWVYYPFVFEFITSKVGNAFGG